MKLLVVLSLLLCVALSVRAAAVPVEEEKKAPVPVEDMVLKEKLEEPVEVEEVKKMEVENQMELETFPEERDTVLEMDLAEHDPQEERFGYCPDGWIRYQSRCFLFVSSAMSWYRAEDYCNQRHGSLVSVHNPREHSFLQQQMSVAGWPNTWLGGFNLQNQWRWIDHEGLYYTNWYSLGSVASYPCMYMGNTLGWRNSACSSSLRFICGRNFNNC
ncbi:dromaiocalcin-2-like [Osmerus mordax]|uniref:dromaiocalcin-2-like n=1 Tax=Osmerus mordax TaxID=8014 RepID=UPI00350EBFA2